MNYQPALATSALRCLHDELVAYVTLFCDERDLLQLMQTNSALYVFCREEPLWMMHCLRLHRGAFFYRDNWRLTTFFPRDRPAAMPTMFAPITARGFASEFLYRRWCRCHMALQHFVPLDASVDPFAKRVPKIDVNDITYQQYYQEFSRTPFILTNAVTKWRAASEWTPEHLVARFGDAATFRLTHNLDFFGSDSASSLQMTFRDYFQYVQHQADETPLYIFDPDFGAKLPALVSDYDVADLQLFQEDLLAAIVDDPKLPKSQSMSETSQFTGANDAAASGNTVDPPSPLISAKPSKSSKSERPDYRWLVVGPERTGAPWHTDPARTSAWNTLVYGRKRWAIYPPDSPPPGVAVATSKGASQRQQALGMTSLAWYLHVYPTLAPHEKPIEIIQEPGETIYVPSGWWHLILNLDTTVAVTQNFVDSHNLLAFLNDLLDDQHDERLEQFECAMKRTQPAMADVFRLVQIPRMHGYLTQDLYVQTFGQVAVWKPRLLKIVQRHRAVLGSLNVLRVRKDGDDRVGYKSSSHKVQLATITSRTARVNPTFSVGSQVLVKLFSQFNQRWGEFDFASFFAPDFCRLKGDSDALQAPMKRTKRSVIQSHELRQAMSMRLAMEESFRIERDTLALIAAAASVTDLQALVPRLFASGHVFDVRDVDSEDDDDNNSGFFWRWPYVVIECRSDLEGLDKIVKRGGMTQASWFTTAKWISATFLPKLHAVPLENVANGLHGHCKRTWDWYIHYLLSRRYKAIHFHYKADVMPPQLLRSLAMFLPASTVDAIVRDVLPLAAAATSKPVLLHGDLTQENILGATMTTRSKAAGAKTPAIQDGNSNASATSSPVAVDAVATEAADDAIEDNDDNSKWESCSDSDSSDDDDDDDIHTIGYVAADAARQRKHQQKFVGHLTWSPQFVIDFADAKTGDPLYDLVAVFFAALNSDVTLWRATLETPYWKAYIAREHDAAAANGPQDDATAMPKSIGTQLRERFLKLVLLHPSRSIKSLMYFRPDAARLATWEDVARVVFGDCFEL